MKKINLFAYAQLKPPGKYAPKTKTKPVEAEIRAKMFQLKNDAGIKKVGKTKTITEGKILKVTPKKFKNLGKMERPEFRPVKTKTTDGKTVEAFKYIKKVPKNAKLIKNFKTR
jgi:hypothetical protein